MSLDQSLNILLDQLLPCLNAPLNNQQLINCIDLTLLDEHASNDALKRLAHQAVESQTAAICVYPAHLVNIHLDPTISLATVVNFPHGTQSIDACLHQIRTGLTYNAQEIDYVFPYALYLNGKKREAMLHATEIIQFCKLEGLKTKIIVETGAFPLLEPLYELASELLLLGCDFLKTSTGTINQGASYSAVMTLLSAIKESTISCGIKVSGGIRTPVQARNYANLAQLMLNKPIDKAWFRIGASSLLESLQKNN